MAAEMQVEHPERPDAGDPELPSNFAILLDELRADSLAATLTRSYSTAAHLERRKAIKAAVQDRLTAIQKEDAGNAED